MNLILVSKHFPELIFEQGKQIVQYVILPTVFFVELVSKLGMEKVCHFSYNVLRYYTTLCENRKFCFSG